MELHVGADRHDGVRYRVGLVLVALRLVVVEALVVLLSRDGAQGQKMDQEGKYVPGREAHVWSDGQVQQNRSLCLLSSLVSALMYFSNVVSPRILEQRELSEKLKPGRLLNREREGGRELA